LGEAERIVEVVGGGQQVRVRPQGVARLGASLATDGGEDGVRFAQGPWPQFHSHEGSKGSLGRSPGGAAAAHRFGERCTGGEPVAAGLRHHFVHPSFDARQQGFESGHSGLLFGCVLGREQTSGQHLLQRLGVGDVDATHRFGQALGVDAQVLRVLLYRSEHPGCQPRHVHEQPLMRGLAQRDVHQGIGR